MITKEDRIKMFANEIGYIADENLKKYKEFEKKIRIKRYFLSPYP